ncbi:hypothetical protein B7463_g4951, partial [Scytalidium lignicola]
MDAIRKTVRPVVINEFVDALFKIWSPSNFLSGQNPVTLGLAISGGVDSMALAALCSRMIRYQRDINASIPNISLQAFIVDHQARLGSKLEAENVAKVLEKSGIRTQVLTLDWREIRQPSELANFETLARKYRFRALGLACKNHNIESLLLAHHEDDQTETVLMRLIAGHRGLGLTGIKPSSGIPECYGIHGVYESGAIDSQLRDSKSPDGSLDNNLVLYKNYPELEARKLFNLEDGGIRVYRPLLGFSKARLIATAQAEDMPWFEDITNNDPTITRRNAIRHLYKSYNLPAALRKPALLAMSIRIESEQAALHDTAKCWLSQCKIMGFEWRTGTLRIRFLRDLEQLRLPSDLSAAMPLRKAQAVALLLLRQVITLVTPDEHVHLSSLHGTVERIFPELFPGSKQTPYRASFTVAGVQFQPFSPKTKKQLSVDHEMASSTLLQNIGWFLSRQQYSSNLNKRPVIEIPPSNISSQQHPWSPWVLYDGRYWIRILSRYSVPLRIQPFRKEDLQGFKQSLSKDDRKSLEKMLKEFAPGNIRWTLPAVVALHADGSEKVLCLPTLDFSTPEPDLEWQVRYKKVDMDDLKLDKRLSV